MLIVPSNDCKFSNFRMLLLIKATTLFLKLIAAAIVSGVFAWSIIILVLSTKSSSSVLWDTIVASLPAMANPIIDANVFLLFFKTFLISSLADLKLCFLRSTLNFLILSFNFFFCFFISL